MTNFGRAKCEVQLCEVQLYRKPTDGAYNQIDVCLNLCKFSFSIRIFIITIFKYTHCILRFWEELDNLERKKGAK